MNGTYLHIIYIYNIQYIYIYNIYIYNYQTGLPNLSISRSFTMSVLFSLRNLTSWCGGKPFQTSRPSRSLLRWRARPERRCVKALRVPNPRNSKKKHGLCQWLGYLKSGYLDKCQESKHWESCKCKSPKDNLPKATHNLMFSSWIVEPIG